VKLTKELPTAARAHLLRRIKDRQITDQDAGRIAFWIASDPDVPDGDWYKDFGNFKVVGCGPLILTFLQADMEPYGIKVE
jgi:hypothetical protein